MHFFKKKPKVPAPNEYIAKKTSSLSPLNIPEILEIIFSFLSPHVLKKIIPLVCRQWNSITPLIDPYRTITWKVKTMSSGSQIDQSLQELQEASGNLKNNRSFKIAFMDDHTQEEFASKSAKFIDMANQHNIRIADLTVVSTKYQLIYEDVLSLFFNYAGWSLRTFHLENIRHPFIPLRDILVACPKLHTLTISRVSRRSNTPLGDPQTSEQSNPSSFPALRSLALSGVRLEADSFLSVLKDCTNLEDLELKGIDGFEELSSTGISYVKASIQTLFQYSFYTRLAEACPSLRKLHLSDSYGPFHFGFVTNSNLKLLVDSFPKVTEWGISSRLQNAMLYNEMKPFVQNVVTSFEIEGATRCANNTLHYFLCDAPHLLHLYAIGYFFPNDLFDLEGTLSRSGDCVGLDSTNCRKIWACRNLKTLHLKFDNDRTLKSTSETISRIFFGYISKVCPRLQDLDINNKHLSLQLDGGFCLLSGLPDLKRLRLSSVEWHKPRLAEFSWIAKGVSPSLKKMISIWITKLKIQEQKTFYARTPFRKSTNARKFPNEEQVPGANGDHIIDGIDMKNLGKLKDIVIYLQERQSNNTPCFPSLETVTLFDLEILQEIRKYRPELELKRT